MTVFLHNLKQSFRPFNLSTIKRFLSTDYKLTFKHIFSLIAFYLLSAVLLFSGIAKIIDPLPLINTLTQITFLPTELQILIATLLPVVEIGLAVVMIMRIKQKITLPTVAVLFAAFLGFSIYGTVVGFGEDCGCFGDVVKSSFGWKMILRNTLFFIMCLMINIYAWPSKLNNKLYRRPKMKKLNLFELQKQFKASEKIPIKKLIGVIGGKNIAGCCRGYCQECDSDTYQTSADDNRSLDAY